MSMCSDEWRILRKGERRPIGRVLVAYYDSTSSAEQKLINAIFGKGEAEPRLDIEIAWWRKGKWHNGRGPSTVGRVVAWMPLPEIPEWLEARDE